MDRSESIGLLVVSLTRSGAHSEAVKAAESLLAEASDGLLDEETVSQLIVRIASELGAFEEPKEKESADLGGLTSVLSRLSSELDTHGSEASLEHHASLSRWMAALDEVQGRFRRHGFRSV